MAPGFFPRRGAGGFWYGGTMPEGVDGDRGEGAAGEGEAAAARRSSASRALAAIKASSTASSPAAASSLAWASVSCPRNSASTSPPMSGGGAAAGDACVRGGIPDYVAGPRRERNTGHAPNIAIFMETTTGPALHSAEVLP